MDKHEPVAWAYPEFFDGLKNNGCWTVYGKEGKGPHWDGIKRTPLYLAPPKREWVGLTEAEVWDLWNAHIEQPFPEWFVDFKRAYEVIQAKLKEKNGG